MPPELDTRLCHGFWATVCKTVRSMLSDRCLSVCLSCLSCPVCPVCNVAVLWPNSLTDQDETWRAARPRSWTHCIRWRPSSPSFKGAQPPDFRPISVAAKWLHRSRCHLVGRYASPKRHCVRWGPRFAYLKGTHRPNFRPTSVAVKWLHRSDRSAPPPPLKLRPYGGIEMHVSYI